MVLAVLILASSCTPKQDEDSYLVVLSMDGFRWDYPEKAHTPTLDSLARFGVKAEALMPSFPSKTFPNHYTMATGLYPGHHGIVMNSFYAPDLDLYYRIGDRDAVENPEFYGGEPIWVSAENQDVTAATFFWVGSEAPVKGKYATYWKKYDHDFPFNQRVDTVISWLKKDKEIRPHLVMWYLDQPDSDGHEYGPDAPEIINRIEELDQLLADFFRKVNQLSIAPNINFIITSDHGMGAISTDRTVNLRDHLKDEWLESIESGNPVMQIDAADGFEDSVYNRLKKVEHIEIYRPEETPADWHFSDHIRIKDFIVVADSSYSILKREGKPGYNGGTHGYPPENKDMHAIFYAIGPDFKAGYQQPLFKNVDLYNLFCELLEIQPAPNDGNIKRVKGMLKTD